MGRLTRGAGRVVRALLAPIYRTHAWLVHRPAPDEHPLKCRYCAAPIRLVTENHPLGPIYRGADGHYVCAHDFRIGHQPMPTIR